MVRFVNAPPILRKLAVLDAQICSPMLKCCPLPDSRFARYSAVASSRHKFTRAPAGFRIDTSADFEEICTRMHASSVGSP